MVHLYHLLDSPVIHTAEMRGILENTPPEAICSPRPERLPKGKPRGQSQGLRGANCRGGRIFQFIPTRGSMLPFFFPEREFIGYYTPDSWVVFTV